MNNEALTPPEPVGPQRCEHCKTMVADGIELCGECRSVIDWEKIQAVKILLGDISVPRELRDALSRVIDLAEMAAE